MAVYVAIAVALLSFAGGYHVSDLQADAEQAQAVSFALAKAALEDELSRNEEIDLIKSQQKTKIVYKTITKEVPVYVSDIQKNDSECNLSHGIVGLYNRAATEQLPETTGSDDARNTQPSTVKESDLIDYGLDVINQYNDVKNQCNALIKWQKHVSEINQKKD